MWLCCAGVGSRTQNPANACEEGPWSRPGSLPAQYLAREQGRDLDLGWGGLLLGTRFLLLTLWNAGCCRVGKRAQLVHSFTVISPCVQLWPGGGWSLYSCSDLNCKELTLILLFLTLGNEPKGALPRSSSMVLFILVQDLAELLRSC